MLTLSSRRCKAAEVTSLVSLVAESASSSQISVLLFVGDVVVSSAGPRRAHNLLDELNLGLDVGVPVGDVLWCGEG